MLIAILKQLGVYEKHPVPASTLFFEVHKEIKYGTEEPEYFVQTIFNGKWLTVRGGRKKCEKRLVEECTDLVSTTFIGTDQGGDEAAMERAAIDATHTRLPAVA